MEIHATADISALRDEVTADLAGIATPLLTRLENVDRLIAERLEDLAALRELRLGIVRAVRPLVGEDAIPLEPGRNAKPGPQKPGTKKKGSSLVSPARVDETLAWLRGNMNGNSFTTKVVQQHQGASEATASATLRMLVDRQQIRLDSVRGIGGARSYRLVES